MREQAVMILETQEVMHAIAKFDPIPLELETKHYNNFGALSSTDILKFQKDVCPSVSNSKVIKSKRETK